MEDANTTVQKSPFWDGVKILLASVPSFSLFLASLYYFTFFLHFEGLNLNILSLKDYFDKSIEFIPIVAGMVIFFLVQLFLRPPQLTNETDSQYYNRIGGSKKSMEITRSIHINSIYFRNFIHDCVSCNGTHSPSIYCYFWRSLIHDIFW